MSPALDRDSDTGAVARGKAMRDRNEAKLIPRFYFHVTSIAKKWAKTSRFGVFFGFCCGLRM